jgi:hypothetical protein
VTARVTPRQKEGMAARRGDPYVSRTPHIPTLSTRADPLKSVNQPVDWHRRNPYIEQLRDAAAPLLRPPLASSAGLSVQTRARRADRYAP